MSLEAAAPGPHALGALPGKIGGTTETGTKILLNHSRTNAHIAAVNKIAPARPSTLFFAINEWAALKRIYVG
jgi:hypothetical protein